MNNDARFFFYFSGFIGFLFFFLFGLFATKDLINALVLGSFGCLFFSLSGRFLLCFILKGIIVDSNKPTHSQMPSDKLRIPSNEDAAALSLSANREATTTSKPLVQAQA